MPLIHVKLPERFFTPAQKQEIMRKFMDAMSSIEGDHLRSITCFVVEEFGSGELVGGRKMMTADPASTTPAASGKKAARRYPL